MHIFEELRQQRHLSKGEMARRLGTTRSNYSNIIHGRQGVSKEIALRAYEEFGVPLDELLRQGRVIDRPTGTDGT